MPTTGDASKTQAQQVRERFAATLNARIELVAKFLIGEAEVKVDAYFEDKLSKGLDPYPTKHETRAASRTTFPEYAQTAEIPLFDAAAAFSSGNRAELEEAYRHIAGTPNEWQAAIVRLRQALEANGFTVYFGTDVKDPKQIVLRLHDDSFSRAVSNTLKNKPIDDD